MSVKNVLISIKGIQLIDGEHDIIELTTFGNLLKNEKGYVLSYSETEATGMSDFHTTLHIENGQRVTMHRSGAVESELIIEKGCRHQCHYETGFGPILVGISGDSIKSTLSDTGGEIDFSYSMDINTALTSENRVIITVKECSPS